MEQIISDFGNIFTAAGVFAFINVMLIDIVMSGDNAIVIGLATKTLQGPERKKAIALGVILATVLRIIFACSAVMLLKIIGLKFAGGILLLYVAWKFYSELRAEKHGEQVDGKPAAVRSLASAIWLIVLADVSMSLDNVLAVSGAARENLVILAIGLVFSILLMAIASNYIAGKMDKYPQIQWLGLLIILFVSIEMLLSGSSELDSKLFHVNILPFTSIVLGIIGFQLHARYVRPASEEKMAAWFSGNWKGIFIAGLLVILSMCFFGDKVHSFFTGHTAALYFILAILFFLFIEIISIFRVKGRGWPRKT
jgi:YjbE family integral membrane protein